MPMRSSGIDTVAHELHEMADRARDLRPVWDEVADVVTSGMDQQFATAGAAGGHPWAPLKPSYRRWKVRHGLSPRTLIASGRMRKSLVRNPMAIDERTPTWADFGSDVAYFKFHQRGTRYMPARRALFWFEPMITRTKRKLVAYIVDGVVT